MAQAAVVLPKNSNEPVMGYLVRRDDSGVTLRQELPGGGTREVRFAAKEIDELILTVSPERLAALDPARPELYREYAEELAEKQRDPEARDAARRLLAICAARGSGTLRHSALLGLVSLARSPDEERKFRAAAFLHDPAHEPAVLVEVSAARPAAGASAGRGQLITLLRLLRQGRPEEAKRGLDSPAVQGELDRVAALVTHTQLAEMCAARQLSASQLHQLLRAELALEDAATGGAAARHLVPWSQSSSGGALAPLPSLDLDRLTEFDPAVCVFRHGQWVRP